MPFTSTNRSAASVCRAGTEAHAVMLWYSNSERVFALQATACTGGRQARRPAATSQLGTQRQPGNGGEVGRDLTTRFLQHGEALAHQARLADAARVARGIECRNDAMLVIEYRHRERNDSIGELILHRGVAEAAAVLDQRP